MKVSYIELAGEKHPLCFSVGAAEEIAERFGSLENMSDALTSGDSAGKLVAVMDTVAILMKYGRLYVGELLHQEVPTPLPCPVKDALGIDDLQSATEAVFGLIRRDSATSVALAEGGSKNAESTQGA